MGSDRREGFIVTCGSLEAREKSSRSVSSSLNKEFIPKKTQYPCGVEEKIKSGRCFTD